MASENFPFGRGGFLQGGTVGRFLGCLGLLRGRHGGCAGRAGLTQDLLVLLRGGTFSPLCLSSCCKICCFFLRNKRTTQWDLVHHTTSTQGWLALPVCEEVFLWEELERDGEERSSKPLERRTHDLCQRALCARLHPSFLEQISSSFSWT